MHELSGASKAKSLANPRMEYGLNESEIHRREAGDVWKNRRHL
jgi:hypothetical protein